MNSKPIAEKRIQDAVFLKLSGDSTTDNAILTPAHVKGYLDDGVRRIVLNMEHITLFYSASINRLVELLKAVEPAGVGLFLINVPERVRAILCSVRLDERIRIYRSEYDFILDHNLMQEPPARGGGQPESREIVMFDIRREICGKTHVFHVQGALIEEYHMSELFDYVQTAVGGGALAVVVDLKKTTFIDSINVGIFVRIRKLCLEKGVDIRITNANELVGDVFHLTGIGALLGL